ncbi:hypothetical protein GCM10017559_69760 [Streptosporangium longisporum]|uniref:Uncharacterized protein n=1 Tax=Streptosporangium longisporum TaxID=46187 RepID=A0ABP6L6V8_9ACTN
MPGKASGGTRGTGLTVGLGDGSTVWVTVTVGAGVSLIVTDGVGVGVSVAPGTGAGVADAAADTATPLDTASARAAPKTTGRETRRRGPPDPPDALGRISSGLSGFVRVTLSSSWLDPKPAAIWREGACARHRDGGPRARL